MLYAHIIVVGKKGNSFMVDLNDTERIYDIMTDVTDNDIEIASEAETWSTSATLGDTYEFREGVIEVVEN